MKRFIALLLVLVFQVSIAAPGQEKKEVTLSFERVPLIQLLNVVYGDILKQNFVLHPDLVDSDKRVSVYFQSDMDKGKIAQFITMLLNRVDIAVEIKNGYVFLAPIPKFDKEEAEQDVFFYKPKYRTVSFITDLTASVFKHGRFSTQRAVSSPVGPAAMNQPGAKGGNESQSNQNKPLDTGTSAYSIQSRNEPESCIFMGTSKEIELLKKLLVQIDTPTGEVLVKGTVYEVTTSNNEGSAVALVASILGGKFGISIGKQADGDTLAIKTPSIDAVLSLLSSNSNFKSISNSSIRVKSGATGVLSVGSDVPVLGAVQQAADGRTLQSIEYKPSGVIFNLAPVVRDASIDLTISQQISSFIPTTTGVNNSPTLIKRQISTTVAVNDGEVIVLGGLDESRSTKDRSGVSFLPDFLKSKSDQDSKTEIILVMNVRKI